MAPKRFKKGKINQNNEDKYTNLVISDVLCPICRSIFIEPVTLPCSHGFCLACFNGTMENATLTCPLCRTRVGSWLRSVRKENRVIDSKLWQIMQLKFAKEIRKKLEGDDVAVEEPQMPIKLADPGEIRREYEVQLEKDRSELQKIRDSESKASEIVIQQILKEEQEALKLHAAKMKLDEEVARRFATEENKLTTSTTVKKQVSQKGKKSSIDKYLIALNKKKQDEGCSSSKSMQKFVRKSSESLVVSSVNSEVPGSSSNSNSSSRKSSTKASSVASTSSLSRPKQCTKTFQNILLTKTLQCEDRADSNGSCDSIKQEMRYFKPIRLAPAVDKYSGSLDPSPPLKLPSVLAKIIPTPVIRSPQNTSLVRISPHSRSAFVSLKQVIPIFVPPIKQPSIVSQSGKVIKQYYNRKRNVVYTAMPNKNNSVRAESPCLGFEPSNEGLKLAALHSTINKLADSINGVSPVTTKQQNDIHEEKQIINKIKSIKSVQLTTIPNNRNGFCKQVEILNISDKIMSADINLQEQLDLEFARRLHEELNNPRATRASLLPQKPISKTRSSPRKRQLTLEELISPKKFKI